MGQTRSALSCDTRSSTSRVVVGSIQVENVFGCFGYCLNPSTLNLRVTETQVVWYPDYSRRQLILCICLGFGTRSR